MLKAIQDKLSEKVLCEFAERYGADKKTLKLCGGYESVVYSFQKSKEEFILKISLGKVKDRREVAGEIEFVNYLYNNGFGVSNVIFSQKGNLIEAIDCDDDFLYARCYTKARGYQITDQWSMDLFNKWGQTMGRMHKLSRQFIPSQDFYSTHWNENPRLKNDHWNEEIINSVNEVTEYLQSIARSKDNYGLVHNDFHQENFFVNKNQITVIDFDDLGYYWYVNDIAIVLYQVIYQNVFTQHDTDFYRRFCNSFMEGYSKENCIDQEMLLHLPYFLRLRHIILYAAYCQRVDFNHMEKYEERLLLKYYRDICNRKELIDISQIL